VRNEWSVLHLTGDAGRCVEIDEEIDGGGGPHLSCHEASAYRSVKPQAGR